MPKETIDAVAKLAPKLLDGWRKISEAHLGKKEERVKHHELDNAMEQFLQSVALETQREFNGFVLAYEGTADSMPRSIQILRGAVRPVLTLFLVGVWTWLCWQWLNMTDFARSEHFLTIMKWTLMMNVISLVFWFGDKAVQRSGIGEAFKLWAKNGGGDGKA